MRKIFSLAAFLAVWVLLPMHAKAESDWAIVEGRTVSWFLSEQLGPCVYRQTSINASDSQFKLEHQKKQASSNGYFSQVTYDTCYNTISNVRQGWFNLDTRDLRFDGNDSAKLKTDVYINFEGGGQGLLKVDMKWHRTKTFQESHGQFEEADGFLRKYKNFYRQADVTGWFEENSVKLFGPAGEGAIYEGFYRFPLNSDGKG